MAFCADGGWEEEDGHGRRRHSFIHLRGFKANSLTERSTKEIEKRLHVVSNALSSLSFFNGTLVTHYMLCDEAVAQWQFFFGMGESQTGEPSQIWVVAFARPSY